jgi:hypothetical protein
LATQPFSAGLDLASTTASFGTQLMQDCAALVSVFRSFSRARLLVAFPRVSCIGRLPATAGGASSRAEVPWWLQMVAFSASAWSLDIIRLFDVDPVLCYYRSLSKKQRHSLPVLLDTRSFFGAVMFQGQSREQSRLPDTDMILAGAACRHPR